jgi:hypothetical protein
LLKESFYFKPEIDLYPTICLPIMEEDLEEEEISLFQHNTKDQQDQREFL